MSGGDVEQQVLDLLEPLYDAALDETRWPAWLSLATRSLGGAGSIMQAADRRSGSPLLYVEHGLPKEAVGEYLQNFITCDPRVEFAMVNPQSSVMHDLMFTNERDMDRHPYWAWLRGHGFRHFLGIVALAAPESAGWLTVQRELDRGAPDARELALAELLQPHLQRAVMIATELARSRVAGEIATTSLDYVGRAVLILSTDGRIMAASPPADRLLQAGDALIAARSRLQATRPAVDGKLQKLIQGATMAALGLSAEAPAGGVLRLPRSGLALPLIAYVVPYSGRVPVFALERPGTLVVITDPAQPVKLEPALLRDVFGLTPAEATLALLLADGLPLPQIAERLAITVGTARLHLHHVFRKTGARRQAELVAMLLRLPR